MKEETCRSCSAVSWRQSTLFDFQMENLPARSCGKTSPESSPTGETALVAFLENFPARAVSCSRQGENGATLVVCLDPEETSRGLSRIPNISESRSGAVACSLSSILETGPIPQRFFLSKKACAGILRRAEKRGKELPAQLREALEAVATQ